MPAKSPEAIARKRENEKKYKQANRERINEKAKEYQSKNRDAKNEYLKQWRNENKTHCDEYQKQKRDCISDAYVVQKLKMQGFKPTNALIEMKRKQIEIYRLYKQLKNELKETQ